MAIQQIMLGLGKPPLSAALYNLLMANSPAYYFRHAEPSGGTMDNEIGSDGVYVSSPQLSRPALYPGGPTSVLFASSKYGAKGAGTLPALTSICVFAIVKFVTVSGLNGLISNDNGVSDRRWQWRTNGSSMEWIKVDVVGGVESHAYSAGFTAGQTYMIAVEVTPSGSPGVSDFDFYVNGANVMSNTLGTFDYGSAPENIELGFATAGLGSPNAYFSESCIFDHALGSTTHAALYAASGL